MKTFRNQASFICPSKLHEIYDTMFELQYKLGISDEFLLDTSNDDKPDELLTDSLNKLLIASKENRDNLVTCYLKQTLVEFTVSISLLTAKIKFIEYKLGLCDGIDLHQACSLSLVNFCNILSDMTVVGPNIPESEKKQLHKVSQEMGLPIWLSHYRNQICHVPSESPCISILVPLVAKSLSYMKDHFWSKVLEKEAFDAQGCRNLIETIASFSKITSVNQHMEMRKDLKVGKKAMKLIEIDKVKSRKACIRLRRLLLSNPNQVLDILINYIILFKPRDDSKNCALLVEQVILTKQFERFVNKLITIVEENPTKFALRWLIRVIGLVGVKRKKDEIKMALKRINLNISIKLMRYTEVSDIKSCYIAHRLVESDLPISSSLVFLMRFKLMQILGKERTRLLTRLTRIAKLPKCQKN